MTTERRIILTVFVAAGAVLLLFVLWPQATERLAPELVAAHVAVQPEGAETAVVAPVEIEAGREFTLHAVLEARARGGETIYYTGAPALELGGRRVPAEALRPWDRRQAARVFWFTVEGFAPFVRLEAAEQLDRFHFTEFFRPEWPSEWSIQGRLEPRFSESLERDAVDLEDRSFGIQRFQVRIELFEDEDDVTAEARFTSAGGEALPAEVETFPAVYAALPGPAGPASLAFGLSQVEPPAGAGSELHARLADLTRRRILVSRATLLRQVMAAAGTTADGLSWETVDLAAGPAWGEGGVGTGDLLRAGARVVVLFRDQGASGVLDRDDLCFDYEQGAAVRPLSEVFAGGGLVELARL
ncbi:MAG TPA: hypothetical protein VF150_03950 [Thermoanaerobaculia bacterium]